MVRPVQNSGTRLQAAGQKVKGILGKEQKLLYLALNRKNNRPPSPRP